MSFDDLADLLTVKCFSFLAVEDLLRAGAVSSRWNKLAGSDDLWIPLVKYVSVPPQAAWKPRSVRDSEEEDRSFSVDQRHTNSNGNGSAERAGNGDAGRWTDDSAVAWLQKQKAKKIKVKGTSAYEVEGKDSLLLGGKDSTEKRPERSPKATFLEFIGRGWYLPRFSVRAQSDSPSVSVQPSASGSEDSAFSVCVNDTPWFSVGHADHTKPFAFTRRRDGDAPPPMYDASMVAGECALPDQLNALTPLRVDQKRLAELGSAFETGSYDVAYIKVWPQLIRTAAASPPVEERITAAGKEVVPEAGGDTEEKAGGEVDEKAGGVVDAKAAVETGGEKEATLESEQTPESKLGAEAASGSEKEATPEAEVQAASSPERTPTPAVKETNPGDYFSHEGAEWGFDSVPDSEHYYRCWTHSRKVSYENAEGNVTGQAALSAFVLPMQHPDNLDGAAVESYIEQMKTDPLFLPSVLTLGCWDRRTFVDGEKPLVRFGSSLHLVNFLVGGHVQMAAAARLGRPVWLLSFVRRACGPSESLPPTNADKMLLKLANTRWGQSPPRCEPLSILTPLTRRRFYFVHLGVIWDTSAHDVARVLRDHTLGLRPREVLVSLDTFEVVVQLFGTSSPGEPSVVDRLFSEEDASLRTALQTHKALRALGPNFIQVKIALPEEVDAIRRSPNRSEWVDRRSKNTRRNHNGRGRGGMSRGKRFGARGGGGGRGRGGYGRSGNRRGRGGYGDRSRGGGRRREYVKRDSPILPADGQQNNAGTAHAGASDEARGGRGLCYFFFNTRQGCKFGDRCWFRHDSFPPAVPFLVDPTMAMMHQYPPMGMPGGAPVIRSPSPQGSPYPPPMYPMMRSGSPLSAAYPAGGMVYPGTAVPEGYPAFTPGAASPEGYPSFAGTSLPEGEYPPIHDDLGN